MPMMSTLMQVKLLGDHHGLPGRACIGLHIGLSNALHQVDLTMKVAKPIAYIPNASAQKLATVMGIARVLMSLLGFTGAHHCHTWALCRLSICLRRIGSQTMSGSIS